MEIERKNFKLTQENKSLKEELDSQRTIISAFVREKERMIEYSSDEMEDSEE